MFNLHEKSKYWHPTLNGNLTPRDVAIASGKKFWFTCGECNHDFDSKLDNINKGSWCPYCVNKKLCTQDCKSCFNKSFASHEKSKYWHSTLNGNLTPRVTFTGSSKKFWFTCGECNHDFDSIISNITSGKWCPYCVNQKLCTQECTICFNKSFASHEKSKYWHQTLNGNLTPRDVTVSSNKKFWFTCGECKHDFDSALNHITKGKWCPYCVNKKLCNQECTICFNKSFASHEKSKYWHQTLNGNLTPRDTFTRSHKKFWFTCGECNHDFDSILSNITSLGRWCPVCVNKTEKKLLEHLNNRYPNSVKFQLRFEWCKNPETNKFLPFDFEVFDKIIIELDGPQHIDTQVSNWSTPEEHQTRDIYKMEQALNNNKHVIRILQTDVYSNINNWEEKLDTAIMSLKDDFDTKLICIGDCEVYRHYSIEI